MTSTGDYHFDPSTLGGLRQPGISGFMRIKNGEEFLRESIESHLPFFDEIVAVYNGCTDSTPDILANLKRKHPDKLKVIHYEPKVHPSGSVGHIQTRADSIHSMANYYNFALASTTLSVATKLDDDHLAMPGEVERVTGSIRDADYRLAGKMICVSGINLLRKDGVIGIARYDPLVGHGDHFYFEVNKTNYFKQNRKFETFVRSGLRRSFAGFAYWHVKYLKADHGFGNYELVENPKSRFHRQLKRFRENISIIQPEELEAVCRAEEDGNSLMRRMVCFLSDKQMLKRKRNLMFDSVLIRRRMENLSVVNQK